MRVLQINVVCGHGSTGKIAVDIANMLKANGDEAYIAYGQGDSAYPESYRIYNSMTQMRVNVHFFSRLMGMTDRGSILQTRKFLKWVDEIKPDIIHLHNIHGQYINYEMLFRYIIKHKIPVVWTMHDCWSMTGGCKHFSTVGCDKWKNICEHCTHHAAYAPIHSIFPGVKKSYNLKKKLFTSVSDITLVPVSHWLEGLARQSFFKEKCIHCIHNGIDLDIFYPRDYAELRSRLGIAPEKKILLGVSSGWSDAKGLQEMIRLSENPKYQVILVGVQQGLQLPKSILAVHRTYDQNELAQYYSMADVFVNPTYNDTLPTVNIEALACGTPVVTYNSDGSPEILTGDTGIVVERGDYEALAAAVTKALEQPFAPATCVNRAKTDFNKQERYRDYIELYKEICSQK